MVAFRTLVVLLFTAVLVYTGVVGTTHGWSLLPVFLGDIAAMNWPGQFNLDFACLLILSGLWVAWRHRFSPFGLVLGLLATVGGRWCSRPTCC